jgi:ABC-2 type transport system ATP-binding protein
MTENTIEVADLTKHYDDLIAVDSVSFEVPKGEFFGLLGPNGAGKTTTIRMLTGLTKPTSGSARVAGRDCITEAIAVKQRIGVVSEASTMYNEMSAWDNLMFIGELYGVDKPSRTDRAKQLLEIFQLYERRNDRLLNYSKGMKRRVRIAAALLHNPEVLFLDEPTSGLDVQSSRLIRSLVRELNQRGVTVFLTTHYIDEADQVCDRIAIIRQGKIVVEGSPEKLKSSLQGEHIVEVAFDRDISNVDTLVGTGGAFKEVAKCGTKYEIRTADPSIAIMEVAQFAASNGLTILSMNTKQPSLEEVFVKYTGLDAVQLERMELLRRVKADGQRG